MTSVSFIIHCSVYLNSVYINTCGDCDYISSVFYVALSISSGDCDRMCCCSVECMYCGCGLQPLSSFICISLCLTESPW